jgi:PAS domain S-box-containing protein
MSSSEGLYNSRLTKTYIQYLRSRYPALDVNSVLEDAGITHYQIEDSAHWFTQQEVDRFHATLVKHTGEVDISRNVGRFAVSSEVMGAAKQYILGLMTPAKIYELMEKNYTLLSRGANIQTKNTAVNQVEIIVAPKPGVAEKPYQCSNRTGFFEAFPTLFTSEAALIDHPECFHRGDKHCRYIVKWKMSRENAWRRIRDFSIIGSIFLAGGALFFLPFTTGSLLTMAAIFGAGACAFHCERLEKAALIETVRKQRKAAEDTVLQNEQLYNNALLIQEIGQATSTILDIHQMATSVMEILEKRLDFDRGLIMMQDGKENTLKYVAGYGHGPEHEQLLRNTKFNLNNPASRGVFVLAMRERRPFLVNDIRSIEDSLSPKSLEFARRLGSQSLICVPMVYEKDPLGILAVDNSTSKRPLRQSDMNLLLGLASQLAISIYNAMSFEKLQESEENYRELVETGSSLIMRFGQDGRITFVNKFAQRLLGYSEEELLGRHAEDLILPASETESRRFEERLAAFSRDPLRPAVKEVETPLRNGQKAWIAWTYRMILNEAGRLQEVLCIGNDISDLKRADQEKKELQLRLQRAQKMEAIGTLAGGVAHDLNNILSGIVSYPELLLMDLPEDSPLRKPILTIKKSGERAAAIVQDLLTLARRGVETSEIINLNQIVSDYLASPEFSKVVMNHPAISTELHLDEQLLNIIGSPVHLAKTVMNLVTNAAEAMPSGGTIVLRTENRHLEKQKIGYGEPLNGDYVTLTVSDTGIGIKPDEIERIFEPFYTRKAMGRSGTGLGMAVVWGTVKDHRGHIDIRSSVGEGTDIILYLPATHRQVRQRDEDTPLETFKSQGETVLLVDDNREQIDIASEMLNRLGYLVLTASSGEEALDVLSQRAADLVVLDMIMAPGINGLETFKRIQALRPGQKAVIASGYSESAQVREAQRLGAGAYIKKPYLLHTFACAIRTELDKAVDTKTDSGDPVAGAPTSA